MQAIMEQKPAKRADVKGRRRKKMVQVKASPIVEVTVPCAFAVELPEWTPEWTGGAKIAVPGCTKRDLGAPVMGVLGLYFEHGMTYRQKRGYWRLLSQDWSFWVASCRACANKQMV